MANLKWDAVDEYFSGQGVVLVGTRDSLGSPAGLLAVGNVSSLKITNAATTLEHKESHTGIRGTDKRIVTDLKVGVSMVGENFSAANLATVLQGTNTKTVGTSVTGEAIKAYPGAVTPLARIKVAAVVPKINSVTMTGYVNDATAWDYKENDDAGSLFWNDGSVTAQDKLGFVASAVTVGATTQITLPSTTGIVVGGTITGRGFTGANAADLNNVVATVTAVTPTIVTVAVNSTAHVITVTGTTYVVWAGMAATADYTFSTQYKVAGLATGAAELYMRFEGLNTANNNSPVIIEIYRFSTDPAKELDMISDGIQSFTLDGSVLADPLHSDSQYYRVTKL